MGELRLPDLCEAALVVCQGCCCLRLPHLAIQVLIVGCLFVDVVRGGVQNRPGRDGLASCTSACQKTNIFGPVAMAGVGGSLRLRMLGHVKMRIQCRVFLLRVVCSGVVEGTSATDFRRDAEVIYIIALVAMKLLGKECGVLPEFQTTSEGLNPEPGLENPALLLMGGGRPGHRG